LRGNSRQPSLPLILSIAFIFDGEEMLFIHVRLVFAGGKSHNAAVIAASQTEAHRKKL